jgi:hypothetical protein
MDADRETKVKNFYYRIGYDQAMRKCRRKYLWQHDFMELQALIEQDIKKEGMPTSYVVVGRIEGYNAYLKRRMEAWK